MNKLNFSNVSFLKTIPAIWKFWKFCNVSLDNIPISEDMFAAKLASFVNPTNTALSSTSITIGIPITLLAGV